MNKIILKGIACSVVLAFSSGYANAADNFKSAQCPAAKDLSQMLVNNPLVHFEEYTTGKLLGWNFWTNDIGNQIFLSDLVGIDDTKSSADDLAIATTFFNNSIKNNDIHFSKQEQINNRMYCSYQIPNPPAGTVTCRFPTSAGGCSVTVVLNAQDK